MTDRFDSASASAVLDTTKVAFASLLGALPGATRHGGDGLWWVDSGLPDAVFNSVYMAPDTGDDHEYTAAAAEAVTYFRRRGLPFHWQIGLRAEPVDAGMILLNNGLRHVEDEPGMWLELAELVQAPKPVAGLSIRPVESEDTLRDWVRVWGSGAPAEVEQRWFDVYRHLPYGPERDLRMLVGYIGETPVACCYLHVIGRVAAVEYVVTINAYRRQGIGAVMTDAALRMAQDAGCRLAVLTASPDGIGIYRRLGFRECCLVSTFEWHPLT